MPCPGGDLQALGIVWVIDLSGSQGGTTGQDLFRVKSRARIPGSWLSVHEYICTPFGLLHFPVFPFSFSLFPFPFSIFS